MTVRSRAWGVLSLEPNVPSESTCVYSAEISVLRKAARVGCSSTPVRLESHRKLSAGKGREFLGSGSFLSTVVRSEVAGRSAGIDWRRGFDPIDRSISVDSRTIFSSLIHYSSNGSFLMQTSHSLMYKKYWLLQGKSVFSRRENTDFPYLS